MKTSPRLTQRPSQAIAPQPSTGVPASARLVLKMLERIRHGILEVRLPDGSVRRVGQGEVDDQAQATIAVRDWRALQRALKSGDIGFAEGYIAREWDTPDLAALLGLLVANREALEQTIYGSWWGSLFARIKHALNRNSRRGSAKNIHAHYDLGNDFYALWLDPGMTYSSALFGGDYSLPFEVAQRVKIDQSLAGLALGENSRLLEIGCGWGGLARIAAGRYGALVTGVTLSREQLSWAQAMLKREGLSERCDLRFQDYRDLPAEFEAKPFDAIVSIEMFEAVGHTYWDSYFDSLRRCLKPGGLACIQSITIKDSLFDRYLKSTDFIQQYIFPGGLLPSVSQFEALAGKHGFAVERKLAFGKDYAETLRRWRAEFVKRETEVRLQGFDDRFIRIWTFYLAYCEAAFDHDNTDVVQFTLRRIQP